MEANQLLEEELTRSIIGAFYDVYNTLGYGFLEHIYMTALDRELRARGHDVRREVGVLIMYKGEPLANQRIDMVVDGRVVVEGKAGEKMDPVAGQQVLGYLRGSTLEIGLLFHFGPKPGFFRIVNTRKPWQRAAHQTKP